MAKELLRIENLSAGVEGKQILNNINLTINAGEIHVIMGPNGSGKSTLSNVIMNNPVYEMTDGDLYFEGEKITDLSTDKRARLGLFLSFQAPMEVPGISLENFIRTSKSQVSGENIPVLKFNKELKKEMESLSFDESYASRYLNTGFSGGEKKKSEMLQLLMLNPKVAILDEVDSGLDVDATNIVSQTIKKFASQDNAVLIITHHRELLNGLNPDYVHVIIDGQIVKESDSSLIEKIEEKGFTWIKDEVK